MSDTPRTDVAEHNMGSVVEPHYVVDADFARYLERELAEVKEQLRLCNVDQFTTAAELADAVTKERGREWVGLTDREFQPMIQKAMAYYGYDQSEPSHLTAGAGFRAFAYAIEAKLREKNGG